MTKNKEKLKNELYDLEELVKCLKNMLNYQAELGAETYHIMPLVNLISQKTTYICDEMYI